MHLSLTTQNFIELIDNRYKDLLVLLLDMKAENDDQRKRDIVVVYDVTYDWKNMKRQIFVVTSDTKDHSYITFFL